MLTNLEVRIVNLKLTWVWTGEAYTSVHKGFGFALYYCDTRNWLAVLPKKVTTWQLETHHTKPPEITGFWKRGQGSYTERMFEIPVTEAFMVHVIESAFPEILTL